MQVESVGLILDIGSLGLTRNKIGNLRHVLVIARVFIHEIRRGSRCELFLSKTTVKDVVIGRNRVVIVERHGDVTIGRRGAEKENIVCNTLLFNATNKLGLNGNSIASQRVLYSDHTVRNGGNHVAHIQFPFLSSSLHSPCRSTVIVIRAISVIRL